MKRFLLTVFSLLILQAAAAETEIFPETLLSHDTWYAGKNLTESQKQGFRESGPAKGAVQRADRYLDRTFPDLFPELFLEFQKTGNRSRYQAEFQEYSTALAMLSSAYYVTRDGKYLRKLSALIDKICVFPTWVLPAHDKKLLNYSGRAVEIDLASALLGWRLSAIYSHFKSDLPEKTAENLRSALEKRIVEPFRAIAGGKQKPFWWMERKMNWNGVCLAGITGTVLAMEKDRGERARMIGTAIRYSRYFLESFSDDGYCSEGAAYWNYGFGNYLYMAAMLSLATDRRYNLLEEQNTKAPAAYADKIQIAGGWLPAFADCRFNTRIATQFPDLYHLLTGKIRQSPPRGWFPEIFIPVELSEKISEERPPEPPPEPASVFPIGGVAVMRPGKFTDCRLSAAVKGGSNHELHNHNDVGSYTLVVDSKAPVAADPGAEVYTGSTFGAKRYENPVMNSFGHPVPRPAGQLQTAGPQTDAVLLNERKTEDSFHWTLDIRKAYRVKTMAKLERSFDYSRRGNGLFTVTDRVEFSTPESFETTVIASGTCRKLRGNEFELEFMGSRLFMKIETDGIPFETVEESLKGNFQGGIQPLRIGIRLQKKVKKAEIKVIFSPVEFDYSGKRV